jgi:hypothetical protein
MATARTRRQPQREGDTLTRTATRLLALAAALALAGAAAPRAAAAELYIYTVSAFAGLGGSADADPGDGFGNSAFQLGFSYVTEPRTRVAVRAGRLGLADGGDFEGFTDADLTYTTVAGEYLFAEPYYDSWVFVGLGYYSIDGDERFGGGGVEESTLGGTLGISGEFHVTRRVDFLVELSGHYADFDESQVFGMAHAGVAFRF